jgi:hypothetical protein
MFVVVAAAANEAQVFSDVQDDTWVFAGLQRRPEPRRGQLRARRRRDRPLATWPPDFTNRDGSGYNFVDVCAPGVQIFSTLYFDPTFPDLADARTGR